MQRVRDALAQFIENDGHRVEVSVIDDDRQLAELVFRSRGQTFSIAASELEPERLSVSTAYEVPDWVRDRGPLLEHFADAEAAYSDARFMLAHDDTIFVVTIECAMPGAPAFTQIFWQVVARVREAGTTALERMVDRTESKAAADKFIREFMRGER